MIKTGLKRIIALLILIVFTFPYSLCFASAQLEMGRVLAEFSYDFCKKYGYDSGNNQTIYDWSENRVYGYKLELCPSGVAESRYGTKSFTNKYPMDCVGFVSSMIHNALGLGSKDSFDYFVTPQTDPSEYGYYEKVSANKSDWKPGDILRIYNGDSTHVMIYLENMGGYNVAHSTSSEWIGATLTNSGCSGYTAYRLAEDVAATVKETGTYKNNVAGGLNSLGAGMGSESEFYYNGVPDGKYSVAGSFWEWIVDTLKEIFTFLVNIIFYIFRMVFVGFTAIVDNLITYVVKSIAGTEANFFKDATSGWRKEDNTVEKVNIETIIFGEEDPSTGETNHIFDVNFFKPAPATP